MRLLIGYYFVHLYIVKLYYGNGQIGMCSQTFLTFDSLVDEIMVSMNRSSNQISKGVLYLKESIWLFEAWKGR